MTFDELMSARDWRPLRNCPGRFVLRGAGDCLRPQDILGDEVEAREFRVEAAQDAVLVAEFEDGGLISYRRNDGSVLHTLNTSEGFRRKLLQLKIDFP